MKNESWPYISYITLHFSNFVVSSALVNEVTLSICKVDKNPVYTLSYISANFLNMASFPLPFGRSSGQASFLNPQYVSKAHLQAILSE